MQEETCAVCFEEFRPNGQTARASPAYPCAHVYCRRCTDELLARQAACPLCRQPCPLQAGGTDRRRHQRVAYSPWTTNPFNENEWRRWRRVYSSVQGEGGDGDDPPTIILRAPANARFRLVGMDLTTADDVAAGSAAGLEEDAASTLSSLEHAHEVVRSAVSMFNRVDLVDVAQFRDEVRRAVHHARGVREAAGHGAEE